ncbi:hypothetical protein ACVIHI_000072 [Bradyrhizobium sp. USDA 4524]|nr:hypothetical protein [Bradyrhizobium sp. USDA 4538]MCP1899128.1 hypothetical protein [Bradyrhizobium sp. USDA 4537]MCP1986759.1 hypothetical protein [Bradyrhizobium sp. USDA 4539]
MTRSIRGTKLTCKNTHCLLYWRRRRTLRSQRTANRDLQDLLSRLAVMVGSLIDRE